PLKMAAASETVTSAIENGGEIDSWRERGVMSVIPRKGKKKREKGKRDGKWYKEVENLIFVSIP
ncbi:hypothetical protein A2U01_0099936, partial [Trifolium medium]|nr:hypothetical protein [Trifolium medium]